MLCQISQFYMIRNYHTWKNRHLILQIVDHQIIYDLQLHMDCHHEYNIIQIYKLHFLLLHQVLLLLQVDYFHCLSLQLSKSNLY